MYQNLIYGKGKAAQLGLGHASDATATNTLRSPQGKTCRYAPDATFSANWHETLHFVRKNFLINSFYATVCSLLVRVTSHGEHKRKKTVLTHIMHPRRMSD